MDKKKRSKKRNRKLNFIAKLKDSNVQHRHVVGDPDYRKKKYMKDPYYDTKPVTHYPDKKK